MVHFVAAFLFLSFVTIQSVCFVKPNIVDTVLNEEYYIATVENPLSFQNIKCNPSRKCYVECEDLEVCTNLYIECESKYCNVKCNAIHSCNGIEIYAIDTQNVDISCTTTSSCNNSIISINADHSSPSQVDITCRNDYSCHKSVITSNTNTTINCGGQGSIYSCFNSKIYIDSGIANNVYTFINGGSNGKRAFENAEIYIDGSGVSNNMFINCGGSNNFNQGQCINTKVWCSIDTYDCEAVCNNDNPYCCTGSTLYCKGGQATTCITDSPSRFAYGTWTQRPTSMPTTPLSPTLSPTDCPTAYPTMDPTEPSNAPTSYPTVFPTSYPTMDPTVFPTIEPTMFPTIEPTIIPTIYPTKEPVTSPTYAEGENPDDTTTTNIIGTQSYSGISNNDDVVDVLFYIIIGVIVIILLIICLLIWFILKKRKKKKQTDIFNVSNVHAQIASVEMNTPINDNDVNIVSDVNKITMGDTSGNNTYPNIIAENQLSMDNINNINIFTSGDDEESYSSKKKTTMGTVGDDEYSQESDNNNIQTVGETDI